MYFNWYFQINCSALRLFPGNAGPKINLVMVTSLINDVSIWTAVAPLLILELIKSPLMAIPPTLIMAFCFC